MREQWGYTSHGSSERRTIVSGFESKEAALSHAREGSCTGRVVDVGRITHDADNRTQFEVVEKVEIQ